MVQRGLPHALSSVFSKPNQPSLKNVFKNFFEKIWDRDGPRAIPDPGWQIGRVSGANPGSCFLVVGPSSFPRGRSHFDSKILKF